MVECPVCHEGKIETIYDEKYLYRQCTNPKCEFQSEMEYAIDIDGRFKKALKHKGYRKWLEQHGVKVKEHG